MSPIRAEREEVVVMLEIGFVYRRKDRFYLAVSDTVLLSVANGRFHETRPNTRYEVIRNISVERLCQQWGVTSEELDRATAKFLTPSIEGRIREPESDGYFYHSYEGLRTFRKAG